MFDEDLDCFGQSLQEQRHFTPIKPFKFASLRFGGGGGGGSIDDTEDQKELARIASERWDRYQRTFVPAENRYMREIDKIGSETQQMQVAGAANTAVQAAYTEGFADQRANLFANNVNPSSGMFNQAVNDYQNNFMAASTDNTNRALQGLQDRKVQGMQNIVAMGQGVASDAMEGMNASAGYSAQAATQRAEDDFNRRQAIGYGFGTALGTATGYSAYRNG